MSSEDWGRSEKENRIRKKEDRKRKMKEATA